MNAKKEFITWLESGDIKRVLAGLKVLYQDKDLSGAISFQTARYNALVLQHTKGTISNADYQLESAKIRHILFEIVNELPESWTSEELANIPTYGSDLTMTQINNKMHLWWKSATFWAVFFTTAGLLLAVLAFLNNQGIFLNKKIPDDAEQTIIQSETTPTAKTLQQTSHGPNSFNANAENGDVNVQYGDESDWEKTAKQSNYQSDTIKK